MSDKGARSAAGKAVGLVRAGMFLFTVAAGAVGIAASMKKRTSSSAKSSFGSTISLAGKVVLITGASRGLGLALAEEYGRQGVRLVLAAREPQELDRARQILLSRVKNLHEEDVICIPCDLTDYEQTRKMVDQATAHFGRVDVLVNNAGIITVGPVQNQPLSAFKDTIESNYYTMVHGTLAVLPQMLKRHSGSIVNITSIGGKVAVPHLLPYSASKFAAVGFSQGLHAELRSEGIRVTTVCPGLMRTGSPPHALFTGDREREYRWFSLGASLPGIAASAADAARKIVHATEKGSVEITITPQAFLAARLSQVSPEWTASVSSFVNSMLLPAPVQGASAAPVEGQFVRGKESKPLTSLGAEAERRYNEV